MDDSEITNLFFSRSERAVSALEEKYGMLCLYVARNILGDPTEAEECVNDAYLGVWNAIPPARPQVLSSFVCRITRNLALHRLEYLNAAKRNRSRTVYLSELNDCLNDSFATEKHYEDKELTEIINEFLSLLGETERRVFILRYWYNAGIADIAQKYGFSRSKVESMLHRSRKKLKKYLQTRGHYNE
ncbi:MAG: RNA polymerase sigma factor [Acutalibacteraceae bacterium]